MRAQWAKRRPNLTREKILAVSSRVFNQRGYHGTTLADIASALHISKAALYYHVKSKEELLFASHQAVLDIGLEGIEQAVARTSDPAEQLRITVAYYVEGITERLTATIFEGRALSRSHRKLVVERRDAFEQQLRQIIQRGVEAGVFVACDPKLVGFALLGATNWVSKWFSPGSGYSARQVADAFSAYLVRGLEKHPAPQLAFPRVDRAVGDGSPDAPAGRRASVKVRGAAVADAGAPASGRDMRGGRPAIRTGVRDNWALGVGTKAPH
jgi:TetR/AcrR family transcriptional regulator